MGSPTLDVSNAATGGRRTRGVWLVVADAVALSAFVAVGLRSHGIGGLADVAARNAVPLALAWAAVSGLAGTYRRGDLRSLLAAWVIAVPVALLARTWWVGSPTGVRIAVFVAVGLAFTLVFLVVGRVVVSAATRTRLVWRAT